MLYAFFIPIAHQNYIMYQTRNKIKIIINQKTAGRIYIKRYTSVEYGLWKRKRLVKKELPLFHLSLKQQ